MSKAQKYYVVWNGVRPGIYNSWADCQLQIHSYPNAQYKSFKSKAEAEYAYTMSYASFQKQHDKKHLPKPASSDHHTPDIDIHGIAVDAACSGNPGLMEYRGVLLKDSTQLFHVGPLKNGTNNIGEFLAIVHALALLDKQKSKPKTIYTDSISALAWVRKKKANTKLKPNHQNKKIFELIKRAEQWLQSHQYPHKILKWDTSKLGEIPADFGRK